MTDMHGDTQAACLLVVDDDPVVLKSMQRSLQRGGYEVVCADSGEEALRLAEAHDVDVALLDLSLPDRSGLDVMSALKERDATVECVIFTGHSSAPVAVEAYEAGAVEYFEKPITDWRRFEVVLRQAVRLRRMARERADAAPSVEAPTEDVGASLRRELPGGSKAIDDIRRIIAQIAPRSTTVALIGPSGSGKTRIAEALHRASGRSGPLEIVSCSAMHGPGMYAELFGRVEEGGELRPGAFGRAAHGTLVLDEIADLPLELQGNLLQVLDGRTFAPAGGGGQVQLTARVVVTTHEDLERLVQAGRFRSDLLHRLGVRVRVPGLDERREDIPQLVYQFLRRVVQDEALEVRRVPADVLRALTDHEWAGSNVRGLRTAVEQAAIFSRGDALEMSALPADLRVAPRSEAARAEVPTTEGRLPDAYRGLSYQTFKDQLLNDFMASYLRDLLESTDGNVTRAARLAGLHRPNFRRLMKRYNIETNDPER
ncbi:MAG TPA: sigma-54 dependent transcriptional regulator [Myxococcota bacterium]|nr:sigma-54 dependent transcriptional regulator [Myxococcota bacterium]